MVLHDILSVALNDLNMAVETEDAGLDPDLFHHFAQSSFLEGLADLDESTRQSKAVFQRRHEALREQHTIVAEDR